MVRRFTIAFLVPILLGLGFAAGCADKAPATAVALSGSSGMGLTAMMMGLGAAEGDGALAARRDAVRRRRLELQNTLQNLLLDIILPIREARAAATSLPVPTTVATCPTWRSTDNTLVACKALDVGQNGIAWASGTAGPYLVRRLPFCSFGADGDVYYMFNAIQLPDQATCTAVNSNGFTPATVGGKSATITFGLYPGGDQQNYIVPSGFYGPTNRPRLIYVNSDMPSGWDVARKGGDTVAFDATGRTGTLTINGVHLVEFVWDSEDTASEILDRIVDKTAPLDLGTLPVTLRWDATISTVVSGDRRWTDKDVADDTTYNAAQPLQITYDTSGVRRVDSGLVRVQHNAMDDGRQANSVTSITTRLTFGDSACCLPTSGTIRTDYSPALPGGQKGGSVYYREDVTFTSTCGQVDVTYFDRDGGEISGGPAIFEYCAR